MTAGAFCIAVALAGCAAPDGSTAKTSVGPTAAYSGDVPTFTGPWAQEFTRAYRSTSSTVVHRILDKEAITDQDYAAVSSAYVRCMTNKGYTARVTGPGGQTVIEASGPAADAADDECNGDMAVISGLRLAIMRNPENLDENKIVTACLVRKKLVPPSYSAADYETSLRMQQFPFDVEGAAFSSCASDPLGLTSTR